MTNPAFDPERAKTFVLEYANAHNEWEVWAYRLALADGDRYEPETQGRIQAGYDSLLERFCSSDVVAKHLRPAFGDPPRPNADAIRFATVRLQDKRIVVTTSETRDPLLGPVDYEYSLELVGDRLVLDGRRRRDGSGRWTSVSV